MGVHEKYWYDRRIEPGWQVGSQVRFFGGDSDVLTDSVVVLESDPPRSLVYTFLYELDPEFKNRQLIERSRAVKSHAQV